MKTINYRLLERIHQNLTELCAYMETDERFKSLKGMPQILRISLGFDLIDLSQCLYGLQCEEAVDSINSGEIPRELIAQILEIIGNGRRADYKSLSEQLLRIDRD